MNKIISCLVVSMICSSLCFAQAKPEEPQLDDKSLVNTYHLGDGSLVSMLHVNTDVQMELKLSEAQIKKLEAHWAKNTPRGGTSTAKGFLLIRERTDLDTTLLLEQELKRIQDRIAFVKETLDQEQYERFHQIETQRMEHTAFANERIIQTLRITDDQKKRYATIAVELAKETEEIRKDNRSMEGFDKERFLNNMKKIEELKTDALAKMVKELTPEQKTIWAKMIGKKYDLSKFAKPLIKEN